MFHGLGLVNVHKACGCEVSLIFRFPEDETFQLALT